MNIQFLVIAITLLISSNSAEAQQAPQSATQDISSELLRSLDDFRASVRTWEQTEVNPVMAEWKEQFDASLSKENRLELDALRGNATHIEGVIYDNLMELRNARKAGDDDAVGAIEEELDSLFRQRIMAIRAAIPFVINGQEILGTMEQEMAARTAAWQSERENQWEEWLADNRHLIRSYGDADLIKRLDILYSPDKSLSEPMQKRITATRFVLWDGGAGPATPFARQMSLTQGTQGPSFVKALAPSPADERTALTFTVPASGPVLITLHNARGEMVYMPHNGTMNAGEHTIEIPTARFTSGRYYYTVQINGAQQSGAFSIVH